MITAARTTYVPQLLSAGTHVATACAVVAFVALSWAGAAQESREAVETTTAALAGPATHITLPTVSVVGTRTSQVSQAAQPGAL